MKYLVEIEIPNGNVCGECQMVDAEFSEFCHLLGEDITLKKDGHGEYLKHSKCPSLIKNKKKGG